MSRLLLLAQAIDAELEADRIFAAMGAARDRDPSQALVPVGWHRRAQQGSDLRSRARWLRAQAAPLDQPVTSSATATAGGSPPLVSLSGAAVSATAISDAVEKLASQIVASAEAARSAPHSKDELLSRDLLPPVNQFTGSRGD